MAAQKRKSTTKASKQKKKKIDWDLYEQEARRRSAWGQYVQTMHNIRMEDEECEYQQAKFNENTQKIAEIEERRSGRTPMLYIG